MRERSLLQYFCFRFPACLRIMMPRRGGRARARLFYEVLRVALSPSVGYSTVSDLGKIAGLCNSRAGQSCPTRPCFIAYMMHDASWVAAILSTL